MKTIPQIQKVMTAMPHTIGSDQTLSVAKEMMSEHGIRHLPVLNGSRLVGLLSDRDIAVASSFKGSSEMKVDDVMMSMAYVVKPEAPLNEVVSKMAANKYGSVVVQQDNGKVVGIFTSVDALRYLSEVLEKNYKAA